MDGMGDGGTMVLALNDIISARPEGVNKVKSQRVLSFAK